MTDAERSVKIRKLNDTFRRSLRGGRLIITQGVFTKAQEEITDLLDAVRRFEDFDEGNDPYREHDFGSLVWREEQVFWKIDYYDTDLRFASPDPLDPHVTVRVMTVMLAWEY
ncbi:DUF3768 domain-containing protein [Paracoccus liaowanqingii]|uniref:DUF3768 domain-containing protein n=2 Tax=Paracoccus liaowanqingii TaxID=2560053 RepID=A0A4Z1C5J6_9RHOB|nr:DUF3768 domain-containing protein [Paracoccus liaowanqingii]